VIDYDRAAPSGVGHVKCAGNYAADVMPAKKANEKGCEIALYLDAKERKYVEEFSTSNLIAISKDKSTFVTPKSNSILPSCTNLMLQQLAKDRGMKVERRPIAFDELKDFGEVGACGTAVIISPIGSITRGDQRIEFKNGFDTLMGFYKDLRQIQTGVAPDRHNWHYDITSK
jgi:branched-chain amino acid aminotransferase